MSIFHAQNLFLITFYFSFQSKRFSFSVIDNNQLQPGPTTSHYHLRTIGTFYPETFTKTITEYLHFIIIISSSSSPRPATVLVLNFNLHNCTLNAVCHFVYE